MLSGMVLSGWNHIGVFDAGVAAFIINALVSIGVTLFSQPSIEEQQRVQERFFTLFKSTTPQREMISATASVSSQG
jgi:hypothetical protein